jgi:hypothetical protein
MILKSSTYLRLAFVIRGMIPVLRKAEIKVTVMIVEIYSETV